MDRRTLLLAALVLGGAAAFPVHAQSRAGMPRIGYLSLDSEAGSRVKAFLDGMRELGYVEGKSVAIEWRFARGETSPLAAYAAELVKLKPDLIVAVHPQAVEAVRKLTSTIPIVFAVGQDPVAMGFAKTLAHPGGNITGHSSMASDVGIKHIEVLQAVLPRCTRVAVLLNPTNTGGAAILRRSYEAAAEKFGVRLDFVVAQSKNEVEPAVAAAKNMRADALVIAPDGLLYEQREHIAAIAIRHTLPTLFFQPESAAGGGLVSYGPDGREQYRRAAYYVHRILNGAKPGDLPIEQPTKFQLILNLKTAKALGIRVPAAAIARADEVIQ